MALPLLREKPPPLLDGVELPLLKLALRLLPLFTLVELLLLEELLLLFTFPELPLLVAFVLTLLVPEFEGRFTLVLLLVAGLDEGATLLDERVLLLFRVFTFVLRPGVPALFPLLVFPPAL